MYAEEIDERLTQLFELHYDEVLAYCARRTRREDADDIAAEVFAVAWRRIDDIQWETIRPWLFGVARRVLANRWRSVRRWSSLNRKIAGLAKTTATHQRFSCSVAKRMRRFSTLFGG